MTLSQLEIGIPIYSDGGPDLFIPINIQLDYEYVSGYCLTLNDGWEENYNLYKQPDEGYEHLKLKDFHRASFNELVSQVDVTQTNINKFISIISFVAKQKPEIRHYLIQWIFRE